MKFETPIITVTLLVLILAACTGTPPIVSSGARPGAAASPPASTPAMAGPPASVTVLANGTLAPPPPATPTETTILRAPSPPARRTRALSVPTLPVPALLMGTSTHFQYLSVAGQLPVPLPELQDRAEEIYAYVTDRLGATVSSPIQLGFAAPLGGRCAVRGITVSMTPTITLFANASTDQRQLWGVLAHEIGHAVHAKGFPAGPQGDPVIAEGLATWAAGKYWEDWQGASLDASMRSYQQAGTFMPLYDALPALLEPGTVPTSPEGVCLRDIAYTEWGSFVAYLMTRGGITKLEALWRTMPLPPTRGAGLANPALDYQGVYGQELPELEKAWLATLFP